MRVQPLCIMSNSKHSSRQTGRDRKEGRFDLSVQAKKIVPKKNNNEASGAKREKLSKQGVVLKWANAGKPKPPFYGQLRMPEYFTDTVVYPSYKAWFKFKTKTEISYTEYARAYFVLSSMSRAQDRRLRIIGALNLAYQVGYDDFASGMALFFEPLSNSVSDVVEYCRQRLTGEGGEELQRQLSQIWGYKVKTPDVFVRPVIMAKSEDRVVVSSRLDEDSERIISVYNTDEYRRWLEGGPKPGDRRIRKFHAKKVVENNKKNIKINKTKNQEIVNNNVNNISSMIEQVLKGGVSGPYLEASRSRSKLNNRGTGGKSKQRVKGDPVLQKSDKVKVTGKGSAKDQGKSAPAPDVVETATKKEEETKDRFVFSQKPHQIGRAHV